MTTARRTGNTLVELLAVLAVLGVIAGITGLSFRRVAGPAVANEAVTRIADARRQAIRSGRSISVIVSMGGETMAATAHPDGRVVADTALGIDLLSGRRLP